MCQQPLHYGQTRPWKQGFLAQPTSLPVKPVFPPRALPPIVTDQFPQHHSRLDRSHTTTDSALQEAAYEIIPIVAASARWGQEWFRKVILIHSDNIVVPIINRGKSSCLYIMPFMQCLTWLSVSHQFIIRASHQSVFSVLTPSSLSSYWTAWKCFQNFHSIHPGHFPTLNLLTICSFITYSSTASSLCTSTIRAYLAGIDHFTKLLTESPCLAINHPQVSLLLNGLSPCEPLVHHLLLRHACQAQPNPLTHTGSVASRHWFHAHLKNVQNLLGYPVDSFSRNSFRIGAASTVSRLCIPDHTVQLLGYWSSQAYYSYIRLDTSSLRNAHSILVTPHLNGPNQLPQ
ncbi:hypothetical protein SKAU_G00099210 [Synaphobranchus kaupii]|uniref:Uncharacterized protein n=1 Tax=Synaphobranchus kaupii TaxID=118154 RepID=A0A9Q1FY19_SYNKA|nr:hypothetical protein SKAU_G00099210 [Synaphobranchus kaupii]